MATVICTNSTDGVVQEDDKPFQVKLSDESFETYELDPPPYTLDTTKKELKKMYYDMVSIRFVDTASALLKTHLLTRLC
jgi:pyruvate dehydrogenase E1 component alpha subunit